MFVSFGAPFDDIIKISICLGMKQNQLNAWKVYCHLARIPYQLLRNLHIIYLCRFSLYYHRCHTFQSFTPEAGVLWLYLFLYELDGKLLPQYLEVATPR